MKDVIIIFIMFCNVFSSAAFDCQWLITDGGKYYLADSWGNKKSNRNYDFANDFYDSLSTSVKVNELWGAVDTCGNEIVPCEYESIFGDPFVTFKDEFLLEFGRESYIIIGVKKNRKYFAYDLKGSLLLNRCSYIRNLLRGNILFEKRGHLKIYSISEGKTYNISKELTSLSFSCFDENGVSVVVQFINPNTRYVSYLFGAINTKGEYVVPCIYKDEEEVMKLVGRTKRSFNFYNK